MRKLSPSGEHGRGPSSDCGPSNRDIPRSEVEWAVPLHPKLRERIDYEASSFPDVTRIPVSEGRAVVRAISRETDRLAGPPPALDRVEDHSLPLASSRLGVRFYFPRRAKDPGPVLVYLHGGGWIFGDLDTYDSLCREIAARAEIVVASVDYQRSPEEKFPVALEAGYSVLQWLADPTTARRFNVDPGQLAVGGDSAGGNMAAVLSVLSRDRDGPHVAGQVLIYPVTAYLSDTPSYRANGTGFGLDASFMPWMWDQYLASPSQGQDSRVAPLRASSLSGVAPALVITAEYDILRDEGELYADRLRQAGVAAQATRYNGMVHGFLDYRGLVPQGWDAIDEIAKTLRRWFES
jgi:acetyl esterase